MLLNFHLCFYFRVAPSIIPSGGYMRSPASGGGPATSTALTLSLEAVDAALAHGGLKKLEVFGPDTSEGGKYTAEARPRGCRAVVSSLGARLPTGATEGPAGSIKGPANLA